MSEGKNKKAIDSIETYGYRTSKDLVSEKEEIKWFHRRYFVIRYITLIKLDNVSYITY